MGMKFTPSASMKGLSFEAAAGAVELWCDLLRLWEGFRSTGQRQSASGIQLVIKPPVGPNAEADRQYDVIVGAISPERNCTVTLTTPTYGSLTRVQLRKGVPQLILGNNCIPIFTLNCHISFNCRIPIPGFQLVYAKLPSGPEKDNLGLPAVVVNRLVVDVRLRKRTVRDTDENSLFLPYNIPWQVMVKRKRHWLRALEGELMAAACHPRRLSQIVDSEELQML